MRDARWTVAFKNVIIAGAVRVLCQGPGGRLNKKDGLTGYGDSHVKDKTS